MEYVSCGEAKSLPGLRLVLSPGLPNAWGEAAKGIFKLRGVAFVAVPRVGLDDDQELFEWTGHRNVPVAMYENERPRERWLDIVYLAERLGTGPSLLPAGYEDKALSIGLSNLVCGEEGLGWTRRLDMYRNITALADDDPIKLMIPRRLYEDYRINAATMATGTDNLIRILNFFHQRLETQQQAGSRYMIGGSLTATDIHFAAIFGTVDPLPDSVCPMPEFLRNLYEGGEPRVREAVTPLLRSYRDFIYEQHLSLPMDF